MLIRSFAVIAAKLVFAAFAVFAFSAAAEAQFLTFVSATGVDTRPCTVEAQPCKTLQRAVAVTSAGGTIRILSDLVGQPVPAIAKSLTVEGGGNSMIGTIVINNASAVVILRGLHLTGVGAVASGIRIYSAAAVHIEDCTVERYTSDGISFVATTSTKLFVSNTVARANGSDGLYADDLNAKVVIQNSRFEQNASSGAYLKVARTSVNGSDASGNGQVGFILASTRAEVTEMTADNNSGDGIVVRGDFAILNSAEANSNGAAGLHVEAGGFAIINDCVFIGYLSADGVNNQGTLGTRGNNTVAGYSGTSPTPVAAF